MRPVDGICLPAIALGMTRAECEANARLIAASPELLEALKTAEAIMAVHELQDSKYDNARKVVSAAIAKATS